MSSNNIQSNELDSIFEIVEKIRSTAISDIEKEFNTVKKDLFGDYYIFINSETIHNIHVFIHKEIIYRIEVNTNNLKLKKIELFLKKEYCIGFNIYDEETFFNFKLDKSHTINAIHSGILPSRHNYSDEIIDRIRFNFE